jgi:hypothetical protein
MAETEAVVKHLPRELPAAIRVSGNMTPNELRALKELTGRPLSELMGGDPDDVDMAPDRMQALTWIALRREGFDVTWDQAGDVAPINADAVPVDPTNAAP